MSTAPIRPRNDPRQYDDLAGEWWRRQGAFAALHWLARARATLVPPAPSGRRAVLVDVGCGGGVLAPHVSGYVHVGLDLVRSALDHARLHGVTAVQADAVRLPVRTAAADVVVAGELLEHVADPEPVVAELARVLRPGGTVVLDTINDTRWARLSLVTVAERLPGGPPRHIHDPDLFVDADRLVAVFARHGIDLQVRGLRPSIVDYLGFLAGRRHEVRMLPVSSVAGVYQGWGQKAGS